MYLPVCGPHCEQKLGSWWTMCLYLLRACPQKPNTSPSPFSNSVKLSKLLSIVISTWFTAAGFLHLVSRSWQSPVASTSVSILAVSNGICQCEHPCSPKWYSMSILSLKLERDQTRGLFLYFHLFGFTFIPHHHIYHNLCISHHQDSFVSSFNTSKSGSSEKFH